METQQFNFKNICIFPETLHRVLIINFFVNLAKKSDSRIFMVVPKREQAVYYEHQYGNKISKYFTSRSFLERLLDKNKISREFRCVGRNISKANVKRNPDT